MRASRRTFLQQLSLAPLAFSQSHARGNAAGQPQTEADIRGRIEGLLVGSFIGDALGGPIEFQDPARVQALPQPPKTWQDHERIDESSLQAAAARIRLRSYRDLRPQPEPYAHWSSNAPPGTITDDSRHKLILLDALGRAESARAWPFDVRSMARAFLDWPRQDAIRLRPGYAELADAWLREWQLSARWVLGGRETASCLPPERMWNGLATCSGQMTLPPLAAVFAGRPVAAYRAAYLVAFFDNSWGRDLNAAYVAALATALVTPLELDRGEPWSTVWQPVLGALRKTDPFEYGKVPWTRRSVDRWLEVAGRLSAGSGRRPARLFKALDREFQDTIKWEAQVPFVVSFAVLELAEYHPLAALQLSIEWGHDTDSYAQMVGALIGAMHGAAVFPEALRETIRDRLRLDYGVDLEELVELLERLRREAATKPLFRS